MATSTITNLIDGLTALREVAGDRVEIRAVEDTVLVDFDDGDIEGLPEGWEWSDELEAWAFDLES